MTVELLRDIVSYKQQNPKYQFQATNNVHCMLETVGGVERWLVGCLFRDGITNVLRQTFLYGAQQVKKANKKFSIFTVEAKERAQQRNQRDSQPSTWGDWWNERKLNELGWRDAQQSKIVCKRVHVSLA